MLQALFAKKHKLKVWFYKTAKGVRFFTQDIFDKVYPAYYDKDIKIYADPFSTKGHTPVTITLYGAGTGRDENYPCQMK